MTQAPERLDIGIDEVVIRGLSPNAARVAATALEGRLTELAGEPGARVAAHAEAFRRLPAVEVPAGSPAAVGEAVAGVVWGAISGRRA